MSSTSGVSELEMSSCSVSPASYTLESPHSSPLQQAPQLSTSFTELSCADKRIYRFGNNGYKPYLRITEQPQSHFRFRYDTEKSGSTHGCLLGKSYIEKKVTEKTYPTVELVNFYGRAVIKCSIVYENHKENLKEAYKILEDHQETISFEVTKNEGYKVGFRGIGMYTKKKSDLTTLLIAKLSELPKNRHVDVDKLRTRCDVLAKSMNLKKVRLKFSAYNPDTSKEICDAVLSDPIFNNKSASTSALNITRMNAWCGKATGGEELFLLVDKIDKKDIEVHFYEENENGERVWSKQSFFAPSDVHYQCVIICRTPAYRDPHPLVDVPVFIELVRPSDGSTSAPQQFTYKADETYKQIKKRKMAKPWPSFPDKTLDILEPVKINLPEKLHPQYNETQTQPSQTLIRKVIPQTVEPNSASEWEIITSVLDTVSDDSVAQSMTPLEAIPNNTELHGTLECQRDVPHETLKLQGDIEIQRALEVYKTMQLHGTNESQATAESQEMDLQRTLEVYETIELSETRLPQGTIELQVVDSLDKTLDLHVIDESQGIVGIQVANGPQGTLESQENVELQALEDFVSMELQGAIESQGTIESQGAKSSPMWAQLLINNQPHARIAASSALPTADFNNLSAPMEEDLIPQSIFEEYEKIFEGIEAIGTGTKGKSLSLVSDSGRVKIAVKTSSTQTGSEEIDVGTEADASQSEDNQSNDSPSTGANTEAENVAKIKACERMSTGENDSERSWIKQKESIAVDKTEISNANTEFDAAMGTSQSINTEANETAIPKLQSRIEADIESKPEVVASESINTDVTESKIKPFASKDSETEICAEVDATEDEKTKPIYLNKETATCEEVAEVNESVKAMTNKTKETTDVVTSRSASPGPSAKSDKDEKQNTVVNIKNSVRSVDSMVQTDTEYPAEFTPEDTAEVKKLVQELAEIVRNKKSCSTDVVRAKLERLFDIRLSNGDTFLHMTLFKSQRSFETIVKMVHSVKMSHLLNYGNDRGETILHLALVHGDPALVALLVDKGCDPMARTSEEETCVHYAVRYGCEATLRALLDASERRGLALDLDATNAERCCALHLCALHARAACARLLCARGAAAGVRDAAGRTALHLCAYDARPEVARALLAHGAARDVDAADARRRSPLQVVCARRPAALADQRMARLLLAHGARPPPHMARHPQLAPLLREHLTREQFDALLARDPPTPENESDDDLDEYESADDEFIDASPDSLASRLEELDLFDDAKTDTDFE